MRQNDSNLLATLQDKPGDFPLYFRSFGLLAQLVEQRTLNPLVESSNLSGPTTKKTQKLKPQNSTLAPCLGVFGSSAFW